MLAAVSAHAASPLIRFQIAAKPVREALLDVALQADVSLGGQLDACSGRSPALAGRMDLNQALNQVLAGSGCRYDRASNGAIVIRKVSVEAPRPTQPSAVATNRTRPTPPPVEAVAPIQLPEAVVSEIVVTAQRRAELPGRAPASISALTGAALTARGESDTEDLTLEVAGMTVTNLGPGRDKIMLRGLSDGVFTGQTQTTVGLYLDDVPITYNAPNPDLRLVDIDRVEVMRGPQGTLYGIGSIGGILRIVTSKPDLDSYLANGAVSVSDTQHGRDNWDAEGAVNVPVARGRLAIRGSAYVEHRGGYIDDTNLGLKDVNAVARDGYRLTAKGVINPIWSVSVGKVHQAIKTDDTQYEEQGFGPLRRGNSVREPHDNDFDETFATLEGDFAWGRLNASSARLVHQLDDRYDASPLFGRLSGSAAYDEARRIQILVNEITASSKGAGRFHWLVGVLQSNGKDDFDAALRRPASSSDAFYREARANRIDEFAVFGESDINLTSRLTAIAGARWFRFRVGVDSDVAQARGTRDFDDVATYSAFSPKFTLQYRWSDRTMIYAQAAEGYRAGGFNTSGLIGQPFDRTFNSPARRYDPDELWNFETGLKTTFFQERLQLRAAVFYAYWRDIQTDQFLNSGLPYTANAGDGVNAGLEVEATARPATNWQIRFAGLVDDPHLVRASPAFASRIDAGLPGVPSSAASIGVTYTRPLSATQSLEVDAQVGYVGSSHLTFDAQHLLTQGDYFNTAVSAAIQGKRLRTSVFVDNALDGRGNTFAFGDPFRIRRSMESTPLRPRTIGVRVGAAF